MSIIEFIKSAPWTFVGAAAIIVAALVGTLYAVLTQQDRGFMSRDGKRLRWGLDDIPLKVAYTSVVPSEYLLDAHGATTVINNISRPNKVISQNFSEWDVDTVGDAINEVAPSKIHILFDMLPENAKPGGHAELRWDERDGTVLACHIKMRPGLEGQQRRTAVTHEFGHALLLAHDDKKSSVMHPHAGSRAKDFTSGDVERLRKEYT